MKQRQKSALERLKAQLESGVKPLKVNGKTSSKEKVKLTDSDIVRINKEIASLSAKQY